MMFTVYSVAVITEKHLKSFGFYAVLFAVLLIFVYTLSGTQSGSVKKVYSDLIREVEAGRVVELTVVDSTAVAKLAEPMKITDENGKDIITFFDIFLLIYLLFEIVKLRSRKKLTESYSQSVT